MGEAELLTRGEGDDRGKRRIWEGLIHCWRRPSDRKAPSINIMPVAVHCGFACAVDLEAWDSVEVPVRGEDGRCKWIVRYLVIWARIVSAAGPSLQVSFMQTGDALGASHCCCCNR